MPLVCVHCGERLKVEEKANAAGDTVRRGSCPSLPTNVPPSIERNTATPWELVTRAALPREALTSGEIEAIERGQTPDHLVGYTLADR